LQAAKARGKKLGNPKLHEARKKRANLLPIIREIQASMPTRVRDLYLSMKREGSGRSEELSWSTMDRDLETPETARGGIGPARGEAKAGDVPMTRRKRPGGGHFLEGAFSMRGSIWIGILIGSTIGGMIPLLWGDDMLSYSSVLLSGAGALAGLWIGFKMSV
jgi:hypothetical protein